MIYDLELTGKNEVDCYTSRNYEGLENWILDLVQHFIFAVVSEVQSSISVRNIEEEVEVLATKKPVQDPTS
jgi:hypothetical protein